ncbi:MAG: sensor histidine kinase, partial [Limisphaerales bacterium]
WPLRRDFSVAPRWNFLGASAGERLGWRVVGADFIGVGLADLALSGPYFDPASPSSGHGRVTVVWGRRDGLAPDVAVAAGGGEFPRDSAPLENPPPVRRSPMRAWVVSIGMAGGVGLALLAVAAIRGWWRRRDQTLLHLERARIARDLHDQLGGDLTHLGLLSEAGHPAPRRDRKDIPRMDWPSAFGQVRQGLSDVIWLTREEAPSLESLIARMIDTATGWLGAADIACRLDLPERFPDLSLSAAACRDLLMIFKEAIHNLVRHSGATTAIIRARLGDRQWLEIEIEDDGNGFELPVDPPTEGGLANMRTRVESLGGSWQMESDARGTRLRYTLPLGGAGAEMSP